MTNKNEAKFSASTIVMQGSVINNSIVKKRDAIGVNEEIKEKVGKQSPKEGS